MNRRSFFALLLTPFVAKLLPVRLLWTQGRITGEDYIGDSHVIRVQYNVEVIGGTHEQRAKAKKWLNEVANGL